MVQKPAIKKDVTIEKSTTNPQLPIRDRWLDWMFLRGGVLSREQPVHFYGGLTRGVVIGIVLSHLDKIITFGSKAIAKLVTE